MILLIAVFTLLWIGILGYFIISINRNQELTRLAEKKLILNAKQIMKERRQW